MSVQSLSNFYTLDEYRILEETAEFKNEYHNGEIIPMKDGSINHNRMVRNLIRLLDTICRNTDYEVFASDLRLGIAQYHKGIYPDVMVISGVPVLNDNRTDEVLNPCLISEVLSKSTSSYDKGDKFSYYRSIPELREYVLVAQSDYLVEHFTKIGENEWLFRETKNSEGNINLQSAGITLEIKDIYEGVNFKLGE